MASMARVLFDSVAGTLEAFSEVERRIVVLGCLFSDIGKTGPARADERGQCIIIDIFAVEGVRDDQQSVAQFLSAHFPNDAESRRQALRELGLDLEAPIRAFWNLHSGWTLEILEESGAPSEVVAAAATHHLLEEVNPGAIVAPDQRFSRPFGDNLAFDRAEKLIILLDKYDAVRRRAGLGHDAAIGWLRARVQRSRRFRNDADFSALIDRMSAVLQAGGERL
ncbi:MAG: hypothetical protein K0R38_2490 [Polyangiaceae bacterium]|nr:hypothetical protein [Polyangiaceae bacterium]